MVTKREREGEEGYIRSKGLAKYKYKIDQQEIFTVQHMKLYLMSIIKNNLKIQTYIYN